MEFFRFLHCHEGHIAQTGKETPQGRSLCSARRVAKTGGGGGGGGNQRQGKTERVEQCSSNTYILSSIPRRTPGTHGVYYNDEACPLSHKTKGKRHLAKSTFRVHGRMPPETASLAIAKRVLRVHGRIPDCSRVSSLTEVRSSGRRKNAICPWRRIH